MTYLYFECNPKTDNILPYNLEVYQIVRTPLDVLNPQKIQNLQANKLTIEPEVIIENLDFAILVGGDYNFWDGFLAKPWKLRKGTTASYWADNNTAQIYLVGRIIPEGQKFTPQITRLMGKELKIGIPIIIFFSSNVFVYRMLFYDLFQYDTTNNLWCPQRYTGALLIDEATTKSWLNQAITVSLKAESKEEYIVVRAIRKVNMVTSDAKIYQVPVMAKVRAPDENIKITLMGDETIDWSRFKFIVVVEYSREGEYEE